MCEELHETTTIDEAADVSPNTCLNCGTELNGEYCHVCGQQAGKSNSTVRGFIMEYVNNSSKSLKPFRRRFNRHRISVNADECCIFTKL